MKNPKSYGKDILTAKKKKTTAVFSLAISEILWYNIEGRIQRFREIEMLGEYLLCGIPLIHPLNVSLKRAQRCPLYHNIEKCMPFGVKKKNGMALEN